MKSNSTRFTPLLLSGLIATLLSGCGESSDATAGKNFGGGEPSTPTPPPVTAFEQKALIANLTDNVITPAYQMFEQRAQAQLQAVSQYCQAPDATTLATAQTSWRDAMAKWQQIEVMQIGPLAVNSSTLRNNIYSWPIVSSCGVDQDVMFFETGFINSTPYNIVNRTATRRGLDALEYLLFNTVTEHSCSTTPTILQTWAQKTDQQRMTSRCNFAQEVASDLTNNATQLITQWTGANGYAETLKQAGEAGNEFADVHDGVNLISDALFYIDSVAKDDKLGAPLGYFANDCGPVDALCAENVESPYSDNSIDNLINNVIGFQTLFNGQGTDENNTLGFDDYLIEVDDQATSQQMLSNIDALLTDLKNYDSSLAQSINNDSAQAVQTHAQMKEVTDQLKVDFINSLALKLPQTAAGDND